jgi:mono/diheme cytochrome c family protein
MGTVRQPFTAKVVVGGKERVMVGPQTLGDCNACHTQNGLQGAPGRIIVP